MLSKDAWRRAFLDRLLAAALLAAPVALASCHRFDHVVYNPAPTPLFMEEGLRDGAEGSGFGVQGSGGQTGDRGQGTGDSNRESGVGNGGGGPPAERITDAQQPEALPPTQPPGSAPRSATEPQDSSQSATPQPGSPYETLPEVVGAASGVTLAQAIDE